jgi:hypothetical protein
MWGGGFATYFPYNYSVLRVSFYYYRAGLFSQVFNSKLPRVAKISLRNYLNSLTNIYYDALFRNFLLNSYRKTSDREQMEIDDKNPISQTRTLGFLFD